MNCFCYASFEFCDDNQALADDTIQECEQQSEMQSSIAHTWDGLRNHDATRGGINLDDFLDVDKDVATERLTEEKAMAVACE